MDPITGDMEHVDATDDFQFTSVPYADHEDSSPDDSIASLMHMAEKMDSLIPLDCQLPSSAKLIEEPTLLSPTIPQHLSHSICTVTPVATPTKTHPPSLKLDSHMYGMSDHPWMYASNAPASAPPAIVSPHAFPAALSPCSARSLPSTPSPRETQAPIRRARISKPARKAKTYSKPVASRFCHICSRTPRRGHGAAVCARMKDGLCRKIVCEQCIREQGWSYERIQANRDAWQCPHCLDSCPQRSQCYIYNRINARRKRVTPVNTAPCGATSHKDLSSAVTVVHVSGTQNVQQQTNIGCGTTRELYSWP